VEEFSMIGNTISHYRIIEKLGGARIGCGYYPAKQAACG
jgi:hypothetical protein